MKRIVAFTGAGISKASGIPTFEELPGIRDYLTRDYFRSNPGGFYEKVWQLYERVQQAEPNPAHLALARFEVPVITMNVDGLHRRAGTLELVEIHGNLDWVSCPRCCSRESFIATREQFHCRSCGQVLEPNVILYGDEIKEFGRAIHLVENADILLVVGTSFYTSTAGYVADYARARGIQVEIINNNAESRVPEFLDDLCVISRACAHSDLSKDIY